VVLDIMEPSAASHPDGAEFMANGMIAPVGIVVIPVSAAPDPANDVAVTVPVVVRFPLTARFPPLVQDGAPVLKSAGTMVPWVNVGAAFRIAGVTIVPLLTLIPETRVAIA